MFDVGLMGLSLYFVECGESASSISRSQERCRPCRWVPWLLVRMAEGCILEAYRDEGSTRLISLDTRGGILLQISWRMRP